MSQTANVPDLTHVLTLEEIGNLAKTTGKPAETLMNVVSLIANRFETDVCSAYLLEPDRTNLILAATLGLRPECVGQLRLALNEGLAGLVAEQVLPVSVEQVKKLVMRGKRRVAAYLRDEVWSYAGSGGEYEAELAYLSELLGGERTAH